MGPTRTSPCKPSRLAPAERPQVRGGPRTVQVEDEADIETTTAQTVDDTPKVIGVVDLKGTKRKAGVDDRVQIAESETRPSEPEPHAQVKRRHQHKDGPKEPASSKKTRGLTPAATGREASKSTDMPSDNPEVGATGEHPPPPPPPPTPAQAEAWRRRVQASRYDEVPGEAEGGMPGALASTAFHFAALDRARRAAFLGLAVEGKGRAAFDDPRRWAAAEQLPWPERAPTRSEVELRATRRNRPSSVAVPGMGGRATRPRRGGPVGGVVGFEARPGGRYKARTSLGRDYEVSEQVYRTLEKWRAIKAASKRKAKAEQAKLNASPTTAGKT